uniref:Uncharacterized protein n=1 Tax=Lepeophtheirus salmonis TaxID=72036 RepID=A0A0K2T464_LEPSM
MSVRWSMIRCRGVASNSSTGDEK